MTNILIIEDIPDTQHWLKQACELAFEKPELIIAGNIEQAKLQINKQEPTIILLDLQLPDGSGVDLLPLIKKLHPSCITIIVTIYDDEAHLLPSLKAGAHGYILKDQSKQKIADMLKQALAGELPLSPKVAKLVLQQFSKPIPEEMPISQRESQVLQLIAEGKSTPEVAKSLNLSKYTIEDHIKNIYRKLNISNRSEAVLAAQKLGLA